MSNDSNRTGGVSENTSIEESIREFGFGIKPQTDEQIRTFQIAQAQSDMELAHGRKNAIEAELADYLETCDLVGMQPFTSHVMEAERLIGEEKQVIVRCELTLERLTGKVAA